MGEPVKIKDGYFVDDEFDINECQIEDNPSTFFDEEGNFKAYLLMEYIIINYDIVYVPESGFYIFNHRNLKYWQKVNDNYVCNILHRQLKQESKPSRVMETFNLLKYETNLPMEKLNSNKNRFVLKNGTLDLSNWENPIFHENQFFKEDYSTIQLSCFYDKTAKSNEFKKYLSSTFDSDFEIIKIIQEMLGYCLVTSTKYEKAFLFYGEGSNGKSVLLNVIEKLLTHKNVSSVSMSDLGKAFSRSTLQNKLVNLSSEQENDVMDTGYLKKIISGDLIDAQFKFKDCFEFRPYCKMLFAVNKLPIVKDKSHGYFRRFIMIPFNRVFTKQEQDRSLNEKLEKELDGILQFALVGLKRLAEQGGFTESVKCKELLSQYRKECNPIEQFLDDNVQANQNSYIISKSLYQEYRNYCSEHGFIPVNDGNFGKDVFRKFNVKKIRKSINNHQEWVYEGIGIKPEGQNQIHR